MRQWGPVAVAALVVLAGCGTTGESTGTPTLSPAPVPRTSTSAPTPAPTPASPKASLPPGVTAAGIVNESALARAHSAALDGRSYRMVLVVNRSTGAHWERQRRVVRVRNRTTHLVRSVRVTRANRSERAVYTDGGERYVRCETSGTATDCPVASATGENTAGFVLGLLSGTESRVEGPVRRDGRVRYRVVATGSPFGIGSPYGVVEVTNYTATALVTPSGLVSRLHASYDRHEAGTRVHVTVRLRYAGVGTTRVTPPTWAGRNATVAR